MPPARQFGRGGVGGGGWARSMDIHALDCGVAQNPRPSMTWQISAGGVAREQLECEVIEIRWSKKR